MASLEYNDNVLLHGLFGSSGHAQELFSKVILFTEAENGICQQPTTFHAGINKFCNTH
jgi:hypothetical protein